MTAEEIKAIEALQKNRRELTYGMGVTTDTFLAENNTVDGFALLFSARLSELFGIRFTPKIYEWDELNEEMDTLRLDFTGELTPTPERRQRYFMTDPFFTRTIKVFTNKNTLPLDVTAKERPVRVGFLKKSTTYSLVKDSWSLPLETHFLESEKQAVPLLEKGALDAYVDTSTVEAVFENSDFVHVADYYPLRHASAALATANPELAPIISVMQKYLRNGGFEEAAGLSKAGAGKYAAYRVLKLLTDEEKAYIARHNTPETSLPLGYESNNYPVAFYNQKERAFQGIARDVLDQATRLTGLEFRIVNAPHTIWPELLKGLEKGDLALISELIASDARGKKFIWTNARYSTDQYTLLSRADYPDVDISQVLHARVGLVEETSSRETFHEWFPESMNDIVFADYAPAFAALEKGDIDLLMATKTTLLTLTNYLEKPQFKANITFRHPSYSTFGLHKNEVVLRSILDKTMRFIDTEDISDRWKRKVFDYNGKMLKDMLPYMLAALALLLMGLATVMLLLLKNRRMSRSLEATVVQRTSQLAHASRAKSDFLSSMSHEMRTPLNAVIGMAKIAESTSDVSRLRYCLSVIGASSTHLLGLINDILDMSKIEAGKLELHVAPLNIEKMLMQVSNIIFAKTEEKAQTLSIVIDPKLHREYAGDELRLSQVITNLLSNAVKFTPEGGAISLSVHEKLRKKRRSVLLFSVADSGIGMTRDQINRLFRPFSQADGSVAKRFGGTGLGLAISKNIVEKMNGKIWVVSEPDKGAVFSFEVNLERRPGETTARALEGSPLAEAKILIAEGNEVVRENLLSIISRSGMQCHAVKTGEEAMERIESANAAAMPYSVIFVGYSLPDACCLELASRIGPEVNPSAIVIVASLAEWGKIETAAGDMGVHRVILKPVFPSTVLSAISETVANVVAPPAEAPRHDGQPPDFSHLTLLLVEDVEINREIFITLLEATSIRIESAENGREAVHAYSSAPEKYDVIVMDVQMPVMDGYEATKAIRSLATPNARTVPIIAMTANALSEDVEKCLQSGMNSHTAKPIDVQDVINKIAALAKKST